MAYHDTLLVARRKEKGSVSKWEACRIGVGAHEPIYSYQPLLSRQVALYSYCLTVLMKSCAENCCGTELYIHFSPHLLVFF